MSDHDRELARAFDSQAARFERAPVQSDPVSLARLLRLAQFPADALVLDAGCGPGLVAQAILESGCRVLGVDLSHEMVERARKRCHAFGDRARFIKGSLHDSAVDELGPFDASLSRYVLHHVIEPRAFLARQTALVRSGGIVVVSDHLADPNPDRANLHHAIEVGRDRTHAHNLTAGAIVDLMAAVGLVDLQMSEESFFLDFDEWFDRGSPAESKTTIRDLLLSAPPIRGFAPTTLESGAIRIDCVRLIARGVKP